MCIQLCLNLVVASDSTRCGGHQASHPSPSLPSLLPPRHCTLPSVSTNVLCSEIKWDTLSVCVCVWGRGKQHVACPLLTAGLSALRDGRLLMGLNSNTAAI